MGNTIASNTIFIDRDKLIIDKKQTLFFMFGEFD